MVMIMVVIMAVIVIMVVFVAVAVAVVLDVVVLVCVWDMRVLQEKKSLVLMEILLRGCRSSRTPVIGLEGCCSNKWS